MSMSENALVVDKNHRVIGGMGDGLIHGQVVVAVAGSRVRLIDSPVQKSLALIIKAKTGNQGNIFVGDKSVSSSNGYILDAAEEVLLVIDNAKCNVYIDTDNATDGVSYIGWYAGR